MSNRETFLFYKGIAKPLKLVWRRKRELITSWRAGARRFRALRLKDLIPKRAPVEIPLGIADRMPRVVRATRLTLVAFAMGLVSVGLSVITTRGWQVGYQYAAAAAFVLAWQAIRFGVWKDPSEEKHWVRGTLIGTAKAMGLLLSVALAGALLSQLSDAVDKASETAQALQAASPLTIADRL
ncbi:hypothetical protein AB0K12_15495 [Nonomuraea sp. NPDC049419]|uniref:hypothetical protein n=1 Tax=Nonomuraea sp. NPDC049419 TaxID=3155772 RepID=UPI003425EBD9